MSIADIVIISFLLGISFLAFPLLFFGAPFVPSFRKKSDIDFEAIFNVLRERNVETVVDLGSGDGRVVIEFAKNGFVATGIELNPFLALWSRKKIKGLGLQEKAKIHWGNFWHSNLKDYDAVFIFQFATANRFLAKKLKEELRKESVVISTGFELEGYEPIGKVSPFLLYKI